MLNITCKKCGNNKDTISEMQVRMRNGDIEYTCSVCGYMHKINFNPDTLKIEKYDLLDAEQ